MFFNIYNNITPEKTVEETVENTVENTVEETPETPETVEETPETPETVEETPETPETISVVNKSFFNHLNENECSYIDHLKNALRYSSISLKASFYFFVHAIFPDFYIDIGSKTINSLNRIITNHTYIKNENTNTNTNAKEIQIEQLDR